MDQQPFEIIAAPFTVYLAPVGEPMPDVSKVPGGNWFKLGKNGSKNLDEAGVTVQQKQTVELFRTLGATLPTKASRSQEDLHVKFTLWDLTLEQYSKALNDVAVVATAAGAGTAGIKAIPLRRGTTVAEYAVLVRGDVSPEGDDMAMQYEIPRAVNIGDPEPVFHKKAPAGLAFELVALEDLTADLGYEGGRLVIQVADPQ